MVLAEQSLLQGILALTIAWFIWRAVRSVFIKSPFDGIPGPSAESWFKGNFGQFFHRDSWEFHDELADKYESVVKLNGLFGRKGLFVFDPRALHHIFVKDQWAYERPRWFNNSLTIGFGPGLLSITGEQHRKHRKMLNPVFSIKHMRHMTPIFYQVANNLREGINNQLKGSTQEVDILRWMHRTALELVGQGGLGHSFDPLTDPGYYSEYAQAMKDFFPTVFSLSVWRIVSDIFHGVGSRQLRRWIVEKLPSRRVQHLKHIVDVMDASTREILRTKRAALAAGDEAVVQQVAKGNDILSILLRANMDASDADRLDEAELSGEMSILVFAATDTTTSAMTRTLHLLAERPDVQEKVRKEIQEARTAAGGDIPHDQLMTLPYLDAICRETLRLYSPVTFVNRETWQDVVLPLSKPIRKEDGSMIQEIHIPKGTYVASGIRAINRNTEIWGEDAREWKPERWLSPLPETVTEAHIPGVYSNLMTFIGGSRACIGFKFSQLEMKVILSVLLTSFECSLPDCKDDLFWNLSGVFYPTVGKDSNSPSFPMKLTPIETHA
ncbi:cytochrome P450 [Panus rudis PR-1116 ss-1]|nr:cytochrome P450 [Panus rudis PR-1116 ss-1]